MIDKGRVSQSGNVILALFAAVGMVGVLGAVGMNVMKGPVRGMHNVTQNTVVQNDMIAAVALLSEHSLSSLTASDCDGDGMIEPVVFKTGGAGVPVPAGGGLLPDGVGANKNDPWKSAYGYCVWDHGPSVKVAGCGGHRPIVFAARTLRRPP